MSSSVYPRLYYAGHFYWNPSTYNNDDYQSSQDFLYPLQPYDPSAAEPTWDTFLAKYDVNRANFQKWSLELFDLGPDAQGKQQQLAPPEWNYFGGNQCGFVTPEAPAVATEYGFAKPAETLTTGYTDLNGDYFDHNNSNDPWLQLSMQFNPGQSPAKLVDVNPTVPWSSQIFADNFVLGTEQNGFSAPIVQRMHSRWVGAHNLNQDNGLIIAGSLSAVFQTCFDKYDIDWRGGGALLENFYNVLFNAPGNDNVARLMLRFISYDTMYFHGLEVPPNDAFAGMVKMRDLYAKYYQALDDYEQGLQEEAPAPPENHAYSRVVGWLAPWYHGELVSMPSGRSLLPIVNPFQPDNPSLPPPKQPTAEGQVGDDSHFGPATVERVADGNSLQRITVDLASTVLEFDSQGNFSQFGSVKLGILLPKQTDPVILTTLIEDTSSKAYHQAYHRYSGLIEIQATDFPVTLEEFDNNPLVLLAHSYPDGHAPAQPVIALTENPLVAQTDDRGVCVDEPDLGSQGPTATFNMQLRHFGRPPCDPVSLAVTQYGADWTSPVSGDSAMVELFYRNAFGQFTPFGNSTLLEVSNGNIDIGVRAVYPGMPNLTFYPVADANAVQIPSYANGAPFSWVFYNVVRVLPFDNQAVESFAHWLQDHPDVDLVNKRVFMEIFLNYFLMYPVMQFISSPQKFQEWRGRIMQVVDPAQFHSAAYMPVMRNLSAGQYRMLQMYNTYLNGVNQGPLRSRRSGATAITR